MINHALAQLAISKMIAAQQRFEFDVQKKIFESRKSEHTNTYDAEFTVVDVKRVDHDRP